MENFREGHSSLDVCQTIVSNHERIEEVGLLAHEVGINWRQKHGSPEDKVANMEESFDHSGQVDEVSLSRQEFLDLSLENFKELDGNTVWSFKSLVETSDGQRHVPMMNFHPHGISFQEIRDAVEMVTDGWDDVFLDSGRYYHYYGDCLLDDSEWRRFLAEFLMPCVLVSPRYIGHRLHAGYCTLRLTSDEEYKPKVPEVIEVVDGGQD